MLELCIFIILCIHSMSVYFFFDDLYSRKVESFFEFLGRPSSTFLLFSIYDFISYLNHSFNLFHTFIKLFYIIYTNT